MELKDSELLAKLYLALEIILNGIESHKTLNFYGKMTN